MKVIQPLPIIIKIASAIVKVLKKEILDEKKEPTKTEEAKK